jgi:hypothetical protein
MELYMRGKCGKYTKMFVEISRKAAKVLKPETEY